MENLPDAQGRVSTPEREYAISRLQEAYIRGQLSDDELGVRIDRALTAVVKADLSELLIDLPAIAQAAPVVAVRSPWWRRRKDENVYKGILILDLRQAVLSAAETLIKLNAYKSRVAIIVPPDYRVELEGTAFKGSMENLTSGGLPGAPQILVQNSGYKSSVVVTDRDPNSLVP